MEEVNVDLFLQPKDLADALGITVQGVHKLLKEHHIESKMVNPRQRRIYPASVRQVAQLKGLPIPSGVVVVHLVKGGVGKTTLIHGLAARASAYGCRTLMIDLDQQANLSTSFGVYSRPKKDPSLLDVYVGHMNGKKVRIQDTVVKVTDFLHIIPANLTLANLDVSIVQGTENIGNLFDCMFKPIRKDYDLIFIDCPPSLSRVTSAAHCYADKILLPVNTDRFSLDGLELTLEHLALLQKKFRAKAELHVVINKFDARQKLGFEVINELASEYREMLCEAYITVSKQIDNSIAANECLWSPQQGKNAALEDFNNLLIEVFQMKSWKEQMAGRRKSVGGSSHSRKREVVAHG